MYGNADPEDIGLPAVGSVEIGDVTFVVIHGVGNPVERGVFSSKGIGTYREKWLDAIADTTQVRADEPMVGVGGHSHEVEDAVHDGVRVMDPGSATGIGEGVDPR